MPSYREARSLFEGSPRGKRSVTAKAGKLLGVDQEGSTTRTGARASDQIARRWGTSPYLSAVIDASLEIKLWVPKPDVFSMPMRAGRGRARSKANLKRLAGV